MKATILLMISGLICIGCGSHSFFYVEPVTNNKTQLLIDDSWHHYTHRVTVRDSANVKKLSAATRMTDKLIELEHLYISDKKAVYITTTPSRKQEDLNPYIKGGSANAFYFNTFFFGNIIINTPKELVIELKGKNGKFIDRWKFLRFSDDALSLMSVETYQVENGIEKFSKVILVEPASSRAINFTREGKGFDVVFQKLDESPKGGRPTLWYEKTGNKYNIYLMFNTEIFEGYKAIKFKNPRVRYTPEVINQEYHSQRSP